MNKSRTWSLVTVASLGLLSLTACGGNAAGNAEASCLIGGTPPLTGNSAAYGELFTSGGELGAEYVNDHLDEFHEVKVDYRDGQALPGPTIQAVQAFKADDASGVMVMGTDALVGAAPVADREQLVVLNIAATTPAQRDMGEWVFGNALIADDQVASMIEGMGELGVDGAIGVIADDNELGDALTGEFKSQADAAGLSFDLDDVAKITPGGTDFRRELSPLKGKDFDAIMIFGSGAQGGPSVRQAKEIGVQADYWIAEQAFWNAANLQAAGQAAEGSLHLSSVVDPESSEAAKWFLENYRERFDSEPSEMSTHVFDGVLALATAAKEADSCDSGDVREALLNVSDLSGAAGTLDFSSRFAEPATVWKAVKDGKSEQVELADVVVE